MISSKYSRLIIVTLNHLHSFGTIEEIQKELSPKVMTLVPPECSNKDKIPYLKIGESIGKRDTVYHDAGIIIEDVEDFDGAVIRRLFFESKIEQVQSEVNLKAIPKGTVDPAVVATKSALFPAVEEGKSDVVINHRVLCSDYARAIVAGLSTIRNTIMTKPQFKVLILGTGAGVFPMFLKQNVSSAVIQTVDNDTGILKVILLRFNLCKVRGKVLWI